MNSRIDDQLRKFFENYAAETAIFVLVIISAVIRINLAPKTSWSPDYLSCIEPWVESYRELGIIKGIGSAIGNYYIPYNIILALASLLPVKPWLPVSLVSCVFDYIMAFYAYKLVLALAGDEDEKTRGRAVFAAILLLYLPPVMLNGAFWKQCDSIYGAFAIIALYELAREKYYRAFLFLSIAFVFKLQVILIMPIFLIAYFCWKNYSILLWLNIPVTYLAAGLPAIICGRPAKEVYSIYFKQSDQYHYMFMNTGGLYRLLRSNYEALSKAAVFATLAFLVFVFIYIYNRRSVFGSRVFLLTAAVTSYGCFLFLPAMHERYDYLPIILATLYYAYYDRGRIFIPAAIVLVTSVMYCAYLFGGNTLPEEAYALMCLAAFGLMIKDLVGVLRPNLKRSEGNVNKDK